MTHYGTRLRAQFNALVSAIGKFGGFTRPFRPSMKISASARVNAVQIVLELICECCRGGRMIGYDLNKLCIPIGV